MPRRSGLALLVLVLLTAAGCTGPDPRRDAVTRPTPAAPRWDAEAMATHLRLLRSSRDRALRYAADRLRASQLQPGLKEDFRLGDVEGARAAAGVAGYVVGKHPVRQRELVVVGAALPEDGAAPAGAAAVLELARAYSAFAHYGLVPERTVLFALWPDAGGLPAYLEMPTWAIEDTRAVLALGSAPAANIDTLAAAYSLRVYAVQPAADLNGVARVRALAEAAHRTLLPEVISAGSLLPRLRDTLRVPASEAGGGEADSL